MPRNYTRNHALWIDGELWVSIKEFHKRTGLLAKVTLQQKIWAGTLRSQKINRMHFLPYDETIKVITGKETGKNDEATDDNKHPDVITDVDIFGL